MADLWMDVDVALAEVPVNLLPLIDDGDFKTRETSVAYDAAGMDLVWNFVTCAGAFTQTAVTPTTGGTYDWTNQGDGMYTIEIPASGGASINNDTEGFGWFTGIASGVLAWRGPVIGFRAAGLNDLLIESAFSTTRGLAGTALPAVAAESAGGLYTRGSGAGQINQQTNGQIDTNLERWINTVPLALSSQRVQVLVGAVTNGVLAAASFAAGAFDAVWTVAARTLTAATNITSTGGTTVPQTGDSFARLGAPAGASVSADIAAIKADTAAILTDTGTTLDAAIAAVQVVVDAIKAKTDNLPSDPADQSLIIAATNAIAALIGTPAGASLSDDVAAVKAVDDAIQVVTDQLVAAQAEPTGVPAANATPLVKLARLHQALRNALSVDASEKVFLDDSGSPLWKKALADDGTTYTEGEGTAP